MSYAGYRPEVTTDCSFTNRYLHRQGLVSPDPSKRPKSSYTGSPRAAERVLAVRLHPLTAVRTGVGWRLIWSDAR
jgi:hypothetical protein